MLALRWRRGPPERVELASVTNELAPTLGPEFAVRFISPETGPRVVRPVPEIELEEFPNDEFRCVLATAWGCPSPWKKIPELEEDCAGPPATRDGATGDTVGWWLESK